MAAIRKKRKAFVESADCVACGCCVKVCPKGALQIVKGITAQVDMENAWAAANAQRNVRPASSGSRRWKREKEMV